MSTLRRRVDLENAIERGQEVRERRAIVLARAIRQLEVATLERDEAKAELDKARDALERARARAPIAQVGYGNLGSPLHPHGEPDPEIASEFSAWWSAKEQLAPLESSLGVTTRAHDDARDALAAADEQLAAWRVELALLESVPA